MSNSDIKNIMIKNTLEELEELEKGIVLAQIDLNKIQGINCDLRVSSQIRMRRDQLEEEYERCKARLEMLKAGNLPDENKSIERLKKAKHKLKNLQSNNDFVKDFNTIQE